MPNRRVHIISGIGLIIIFGSIFGFILTDATHIFLILIATILPDIIEPARNYKHRKFFHSTFLLKILVIIFVISIIVGLIGNELSFYITSFASGYILHLVLDSFTPMGLP